MRRLVNIAPCDVFVAIGQSNVYLGDGGLDSVLDAPGDVLQITQTGEIASAMEPLAHPVPAPDCNGFPLAFARDYYKPNALASGRNVMIVPHAVGNTGFEDSRWNPGDDLYAGAVALTHKALNLDSRNVLKAFLWMQGEREAQIAWTQSQYATALDAMVGALRTEFGSIPFICGGMSPGWVADDSSRQPVQDALIATPGRLSNAAYADPASPSDITGGSPIAHYTNSRQRSFAARWWTAWSSL